MKQLGLAMMQYSQDYDEKFPNGSLGVVQTSNQMYWHWGTGWAAQVYPYAKSIQIFKCPSETMRARTDIANWRVCSYSYNQDIALLPANGGAGSALSQLQGPAKTVMLLEVTDSGGQIDIASQVETDHVSTSTQGMPNVIYGRGYNTGTLGWYVTGDMGGRGIAQVSDANFMFNGNYTNEPGRSLGEGRHLDGSNFLMADGHVKWLKGSAVSTGASAADSANAQDATHAEGTGVSTHAVTFSTT
jgi:prepilin-type processing-associated H-X9-DG protein